MGAASAASTLRDSSVERVLVAGEPGGGEPAFRANLEAGWGAKVTEAMGIGDIGVSLWGECEEQAGMHLGGTRLRPRRADRPGSRDAPRALDDGATGELVLHPPAPPSRAAAALPHPRPRRRCARARAGAGAPSPRVRCIGRTDDMLIVRGVNVFPSAIREVVSAFAPEVSGHILVKPRAPGVKQDPPLPVSVELAERHAGTQDLADEIRGRLREVLVVQTQVELVPWGTLHRSEYKSKLVER